MTLEELRIPSDSILNKNQNAQNQIDILHSQVGN